MSNELTKVLEIILCRKILEIVWYDREEFEELGEVYLMSSIMAENGRW